MSDSRRQYSDEDKANALAALGANGGDLRRTSRDVGVPFSTLQGWAKDRGLNQAVTELAVTKKKDLADELEAIALKLAEAMPDKVKDATLQQIATSLGIAVDKMQLLRGKATERTEATSTIEIRPIDYRVAVSMLGPKDD
jgi:transposase-like protein